MPTTPPQIDPDLSRPDPQASSAPVSSVDAPVSFIPHDPSGAVSSEPVKIQAGRYGVLEAHEVVRLLGTLEDERARGRFRESVYISVFFWLAIAWIVFYGPRYLWHAPRIIMPADVLRQRELTQLNAPILAHTPIAHSHPAPKPALDNHTLEKLREMARTPPAPAPTPAPAAATQPAKTAPTPPPSPAPPTHAPPVVADAPLPQPKERPTLNTGNPTASSALDNAIRGVAHDHSLPPGSVVRSSPGGGSLGSGAQILSDTQGVDFSAWVKRLERSTQAAWEPLLPEETYPPLMKKGQTFLIVTVLPDGTIGDMKLETSTHDEAIDRAAWGSIVSQGKLPPLPSAFHGPNVVIRCVYSVNLQ